MIHYRDLPTEASAVLLGLEPHSSPHLAAIEELQVAGVAQHTIEALYQFNLPEHLAQMSHLLEDRGFGDRMGALLKNADVLSAAGITSSVASALGDAAPEIMDFVRKHPEMRASGDGWARSDVIRKWAELLTFFRALSQARFFSAPSNSNRVGWFDQQRALANSISHVFATRAPSGAGHQA